MDRKLQGGTPRVFQTLVDAHDGLVLALDELDHLPEVADGRGTQKVHDGQIAPVPDVPEEGLALLLRGLGVGPQPVLDVDAPGDDLGVGDVVRQALAGAGAEGAEGGTEVMSCVWK